MSTAAKPSDPEWLFRDALRHETAGPGVPRREPNDPADAGQAGDTDRISGVAGADSESVKDLVEEGQDFEAQIISGVEAAGNAQGAGVPSRRRKQRG
jgi:hypothetical protein